MEKPQNKPQLNKIYHKIQNISNTNSLNYKYTCQNLLLMQPKFTKIKENVKNFTNANELIEFYENKKIKHWPKLKPRKRKNNKNAAGVENWLEKRRKSFEKSKSMSNISDMVNKNDDHRDHMSVRNVKNFKQSYQRPKSTGDLRNLKKTNLENNIKSKNKKEIYSTSKKKNAKKYYQRKNNNSRKLQKKNNNGHKFQNISRKKISKNQNFKIKVYKKQSGANNKKPQFHQEVKNPSAIYSKNSDNNTTDNVNVKKNNENTNIVINGKIPVPEVNARFDDPRSLYKNLPFQEFAIPRSYSYSENTSIMYHQNT